MMHTDFHSAHRVAARAVAVFALLAINVVWAAETPGEVFGALDYSPPKFERSGRVVETVFGSPPSVLSRAIAGLSAGEFTVLGHETTDNGSVITGYYTGEAQRFVDCGIVAVLDKRSPGRLESFGGAKGWAVYGVLERENMFIIDRQAQSPNPAAYSLTPHALRPGLAKGWTRPLQSWRIAACRR